MIISMIDNDSQENQEFEKKNEDIRLTLSVQDIKETLSSLKKDRNWLATSLGRSISTVNGWLSAGKPIPTECINEIQILFESEKIQQNKTTKAITPTSDEEWKAWEEEAIFFYESVQEWARSVLNKEVERIQNSFMKNKEENKTYGNPIIFPLDSSSEELWELVHDFSEITEEDNGSYKFSTSNHIVKIINEESKIQLKKIIDSNPDFSLKTAKRASLDYVTNNDFKTKRKIFIFSKKDVIIWSIAATIAGEKSLNTWVNKVIDASVEKVLLSRIGINDNEEFIPF